MLTRGLKMFEAEFSDDVQKLIDIWLEEEATDLDVDLENAKLSTHTTEDRQVVVVMIPWRSMDD